MLSGTHVAGPAGWAGNVFINAVFRANSILFQPLAWSLEPCSAPPTPTPRTRRPLSLWGPVSLSLCNPCPDAIYGGTAFPAFVSSLRWAPGFFSKAFPGPFNTARAGGGKAGRRGPQLGPPIVHQGPHPMSPTRARLANSGHTMGQLPNLAFLLFLSKASSAAKLRQPLHTPGGGRDLGCSVFNSRPVSRQPCGVFFFPNQLNLSTKHISPHLPPSQRHSRDGREGENEGQTDKQNDMVNTIRLDGSRPVR